MTEYRDMMLEIEKQGQLSQAWEQLKKQGRVFCERIKNEGKDRKLFFLGCGDSYFAGLAVREFFTKYTRALCFPMTALEFSKYGISEVDDASTVIAISMSGNVARTLEAIEAAQEKKAFVIGITNSTDGKLYRKADCPLYLGLEEEAGWTPGTLTYTGTLLALYRIAMGLSEEEERLTVEMEELLKKMAAGIERIRETTRRIGENLIFNRHAAPIYVLGAGTSFATAKYAAAKFLEIGDVVAIGQESEEFAHQEFWVIDKNNPVFVLAPRDAGFERTEEIAECLREFGCDLFVISADSKLCAEGKYSLCFSDISEDHAPLIYGIPMQMIAYYYSKKKGLDPDRRSHNDPFRKKISRLMTRGRVLSE